MTELEESVRRLEEALALASHEGDSHRVASLLGRLGSNLVTLALDDGADPGVVERLTHPPKSRSAFNLYNRGRQWDIACREVAKLNVGVRSLDGAAQLGAAESVSVEKISASGGTRTLCAQIENNN